MVMKAKQINRIKEAKEDRIFSILVVAIAIVLAVITAYPLFYTLMASISDPLEIVSGKLVVFPHKTTLKAYSAVLSNPDIIIGYRNTIIYTFVGTLINLVMTTMAAYPLSRKDIKGKKLMTIAITITMFFSGGMIPTYITIKKLSMINTVWSMLLPGAINVTNMLIMKNYFEYSVPDDLIEAAAIDGCSNTRTLINIVLPVSKSIIGVLTVYYFVGHWNSYFNALLYLTDKSKYPLQVFLRQMLIQETIASDSMTGDSIAELALLSETMKYSLIVVASLPALAIYPMMQKFFDKGIMIGSIKG